VTAIAETLADYPPARLFRLGGEEFGILLRDTSENPALTLAERIREAVVAIALEHPGSPLGVQTISIGVASVTPGPDTAAVALLNLSDQALYRAKYLGRNRSEAANQHLAVVNGTL